MNYKNHLILIIVHNLDGYLLEHLIQLKNKLLYYYMNQMYHIMYHYIELLKLDIILMMYLIWQLMVQLKCLYILMIIKLIKYIQYYKMHYYQLNQKKE